jgi:kynureninase
MSQKASKTQETVGSGLFRKGRFDMSEQLVYLDGNSLGPLPSDVPAKLADVVQREWGVSLVRGWSNEGWFDLPNNVARKLEPLIGAEPQSVIVGDSTSIALFKALGAALKLAGKRRCILSDSGNFPTDLYVAEGIAKLIEDGFHVKALPADEVEAAIGNDVAVLMLTEVDYRTGLRRDMKKVTEMAHASGAFVIWDLSHSAGAFPINLADCNADFAVGCGYKFLNGGPGAPAYLYISPRHSDAVTPVISGWMGHSDPFAFDSAFTAARGVQKMQTGTPSILALTALDTALELFDDVDMTALYERAQQLGDMFIAEVEKRCPDLVLASPRDATVRGSMVSFRHPEGYAIMQAMIDQNVIGDFRAPDILRFGITPLYLAEADFVKAAEALEKVLNEKLWDDERFSVRGAVT